MKRVDWTFTPISHKRRRIITFISSLSVKMIIDFGWPTEQPATMHCVRQNKPMLSPESALASEIFDQFVTASTFKSILNLHRQMCETLRIKPSTFPSFYIKLKSKLRSWKAASLWSKLDKRASHKCYNRGKAAAGTRVRIPLSPLHPKK